MLGTYKSPQMKYTAKLPHAQELETHKFPFSAPVPVCLQLCL